MQKSLAVMYGIVPFAILGDKSECNDITGRNVEIRTDYDKNIHDKVSQHHHCRVGDEGKDNERSGKRHQHFLSADEIFDTDADEERIGLHHKVKFLPVFQQKNHMAYFVKNDRHTYEDQSLQ
jgi:hypothetical protein